LNSKSIIALRERLELSTLQESILIGMILGDAHLEVTGFDACLRIKHGGEQKDFVMWKYQQFHEWVLSPPRKILGKDAWYFRTISHPQIRAYHDRFYFDGRKIVPETIPSLLISPVSLAVWIMDDGSRDDEALRINTQSFSYDEHRLLQGCLAANFELDTTIHRDKDKFRLYFPIRETRALYYLVAPYLIPSMQYKFIIPP
jgi:hypothetical protein